MNPTRFTAACIQMRSGRDVLTTGSTANAAARALLRGGAAKVDILAFARVVRES